MEPDNYIEQSFFVLLYLGTQLCNKSIVLLCHETMTKLLLLSKLITLLSKKKLLIGGILIKEDYKVILITTLMKRNEFNNICIRTTMSSLVIQPTQSRVDIYFFIQLLLQLLSNTNRNSIHCKQQRMLYLIFLIPCLR